MHPRRRARFSGCRERAGDGDGRGRTGGAQSGISRQPRARPGAPGRANLPRRVLSPGRRGLPRGERDPSRARGRAGVWPSPGTAGAGPRGPRRGGRAGLTELATRRLVGRAAGRGPGAPGRRRSGSSPLGLPLLAFSGPAAAPPGRASFLPGAPAAMFNRAVSRLSRKRPPSGRRPPGLAGWGPVRPKVPRGAAPTSFPPAWTRARLGDAAPTRTPADRAASPRAVQHRRGPSGGGGAGPREQQRGGSLAERRNRGTFLFSDCLGGKGDPKYPRLGS